MSISTPADWAGLRAAAAVARETLDVLVRETRPGVTTATLDAMAARVFARHGARSAPADVYGFPGTVLISINDEVVHGIPGKRVIRGGDLVSLDVTVEVGGYIADAARSCVVPPASDMAHRLVACAREAFDAALRVSTAGVRVNEIGRAVQGVAAQRGFSVVHGLCGHGVGRTIHEPPNVPNEYDPRQKDELTDGLVITIEPMLSAGSRQVATARDGWTIRTRDRSWAAHYEDTLVITTGAPVVLTRDAA